MTIDDTYKEHQVFLQLTSYAEFYKDLSWSMSDFLTQGVTGIINIDSYVYSSIHGTLESIGDVLIKGRINDAYALLRKYYDSVIINIYADLYLHDNSSIDKFIVEKIDNWLKGKERLPLFPKMERYIRTSEQLSSINELLYRDKTYENIRGRCNDNMHYNYYQNVLLNDNEIYLPNRLQYLNTFSGDLQNIFILHVSYIFYLNDQYMMSSDYIDSLDCGYKPEEGSQYWVAPFIQTIFDTVIKKCRMDIAQEIKAKTSMRLE